MCRWLGVVLVVLATSACAADNTSQVARDFYRQPVVDRMRTYRSHPIDVQLTLFYYGNQKIHPPAQYLAECFALNGADGVALLRKRLRVEGSDLDTRDTAMLLETMQEMGTYDVLHDSTVMDLLVKRVASMQDPGWKDSASIMLKRIRSVTPKFPASASRCGSGI